jgi:hypothetical protein
MGLFSKPASKQEKRAFARGKTVSAKAAESYAREKARKADFTAAKKGNRGAAARVKNRGR